MQQIQSLFQHAVNALNQNQYESAIRYCDEVVQLQANFADAYHVKALSLKGLNKLQLALPCFKTALSLAPEQPALLSNYANLLVQLGQTEDAQSYYQKAIRYSPDYTDGWLNWSSSLLKVGQPESAIKVLKEGFNGNQDERLVIALAQAFNHMEHYDEALHYYELLLTRQPTNPNYQYYKALALRSAMKTDQAIEIYQSLLASNPQNPELHFQLGCAYYDNQQLDMSARALQKSLQLNPLYVNAHETLNKLYWESGNTELFLNSYEQILPEVQSSLPLCYSYIAMLIMSQQWAKANTVTTQALEQHDSAAALLHAMSVIKNAQGELELAQQLAEQAVSAQPDAVKYRVDLANYLIRKAHYSDALEHINVAQQLQPINQELWAYKGTCWRHMQDDKHQWLNDYDTFVKAYTLEPPEHYENLEDFLRQLVDYLKSLHRSDRQPLDQSVRGGLQTIGRLLTDNSPVIQDFKAMLQNIVQRYLNSLPEDPNHPFLMRMQSGYRFTGSWSVALKQGGFHTNHVHPMGWLSCCTYIQVPQSVNPDDPEHSGWIKFGQSSISFVKEEPPMKSICPTAGTCVLFPSYFWHGTNPFESDEFRITIPCDIAPLV